MIKFPFLVGMMLASLAVWMYTRATPGALSAGQAHAGSAAQKADAAASDAAAADPSLPPSPHNYGQQGSYTNQSVSYGDLGSGTSPNGTSTVITPTTAIYHGSSGPAFAGPAPSTYYGSSGPAFAPSSPRTAI